MGGSSHEMLMSRVVLAPRELVWKAWTDPAHLAKWWGPRGFANPRCEVDLRVGGALHIDMQRPDGTIHAMTGRFLEIVPPERLVFTAIPLDDDGKPIFEATNAIQFHEQGPITRIDVRATVEKIQHPFALRFLAGREQGWSESLYRLADQLERMAGSTKANVIAFDARRHVTPRPLKGLRIRNSPKRITSGGRGLSTYGGFISRSLIAFVFQ